MHASAAEAEAASTSSQENPLAAAGTMLLSEVELGGPGGGRAGPLPSSKVQLNDGRIVSVTGNVSQPVTPLEASKHGVLHPAWTAYCSYWLHLSTHMSYLGSEQNSPDLFGWRDQYGAGFDSHHTQGAVLLLC